MSNIKDEMGNLKMEKSSAILELEKAFHISRIMFAIRNDKLYVHREKTEMSHLEWFKTLGWLDDTTECDILNEVLRGYVDTDGVYFYRREDFTASELDAKLFIRNLLKLDDIIGINGDIPVYAGVIKGGIGEKFKPCRYIGTAIQLATYGKFYWRKNI